MLRPNKYTDIPTSILGVSAIILAQLKNEPALKYSQLEAGTLRQLGESAKVNLQLALVLLYAMGRVRYHQSKDVIELVRAEAQ